MEILYLKKKLKKELLGAVFVNPRSLPTLNTFYLLTERLSPIIDTDEQSLRQTLR